MKMRSSARASTGLTLYDSHVAPEAAEQVHDLLVQHGVIGHAMDELGLLLAGRQVAEQNQVGDLQKVAPGGEFLDRVAPMQENAFLAVDIGDPRRTARGGGVPRV